LPPPPENAGPAGGRDHDAGGRSPEFVAAEMRRRAEALAAPRGGEAEPTRDVLVFVRGGTAYALEVSGAAAVIPLRQVVALPGAGEIHLGLVVHRGQVHALVDINALLERAGDQRTAPGFAVLLDDADGAVALAADIVRGTRAEPARLVQSAGPHPSIVQGVLPDGTAVISVEAVMRNARLVVDDRPQIIPPA